MATCLHDIRAWMSTQGSGRVDQLPGYKFTTCYPNANYRIHIIKKEFQANWAKFNATGLYKLPPHLVKPLLFTITWIFLQFRTLPRHTCAKDWQTDWHYLLFSFRCILSNCGHAPTAMVTSTKVLPVVDRDSGTRVQNLYPSKPYMILF